MKRITLGIFFGLISVGLFQCSNQRFVLAKRSKTTCVPANLSSYVSYLNDITHTEKHRKISAKRYLVKVHHISTEGTKLGSEEIKFAISDLNKAFKNAKISFVTRKKVNRIAQNLKLDDLYYSQEKESAFSKNHYDKNCINLYVLDNYENVVGFTHYPHENIHRLFIARDKLNDPSLIHEFGHFFGLLHTFENVDGEEHVSGHNCRDAGDKICDTPADPVGASFLESSCTLYGNYTNQLGQKFKPDLSNYMSYYGTCRNAFSLMQDQRMNLMASFAKCNLQKI